MIEQALLAAIIEQPNDDTPRLVYADWLEEQGDARGEFIRLEIECYQQNYKNYFENYYLRSRELRDQFGKRILSLPPGTTFEICTFQHGFLLNWNKDGPNPFYLQVNLERGFLESIRVSEDRRNIITDAISENKTSFDLCKSLEHWEQLALLTSLEFLLEDSSSIDGFLIGLSTNHFLRNLKTFYAMGGLIGVSAIEMFVNSPVAESLTRMVICYNETLDALVVKSIANSPRLACLKELVLNGCHINDDAANYLIESPYLKEIKKLSFSTFHFETLERILSDSMRRSLLERFPGKIKFQDSHTDLQ